MDRRNLKSSIITHLEFLYGSAAAGPVMQKLEQLMEKYPIPGQKSEKAWDQTDVLLITYGDSISQDGASPLAGLSEFLHEHILDAVSFVHLLPFFPYTSDDGFSVVDFREVDPGLGNWNDIRHLSRDYRLVFDGVINHVSASSRYMLEQCTGNPAYQNFVLTIDPDTDLHAVTRPRNLPLLHPFETSEGEQWFWTTFSRDQVDLNFKNPEVLLEILDVLLFYTRQGAQMIRLDAIPYLWKEPGTSCIHLPQTHTVVKLFRAVLDAAAPGTIILTETNVPHKENMAYFGDSGDEAQMIYNFTLPPLILFALHTRNARELTQWASSIRKISDANTFLNITATHDGIGLRPTEGLLTDSQRQQLVELAERHGGLVSWKRNSDGTDSPYELNISYFDAVNDPKSALPLEEQVSRFMLAQSIPLSFIGIPGIYIHSLLGTRNDYEGVKASGTARAINRKKLRLDELDTVLSVPESLTSRVLSRYIELLSIRRKQSAFNPDADQDVLDLGPELFAIRRSNRNTGQTIAAVHNVTGSVVYASLLESACCPETDLITGENLSAAAEVRMDPWQVRWIEIRT